MSYEYNLGVHCRVLMVSDAKYTTLITHTSVFLLACVVLDGGGWLGSLLTSLGYSLPFLHVWLFSGLFLILFDNKVHTYKCI